MARRGFKLGLLGFLGTVVAFPPPGLKASILPGIRLGLFSLFILTLAVGAAIIGSVRIARSFPLTGVDRSERVAIGIAAPVLVIIVISLYLVTLGRLATNSPIVISALIFAVAGGLGFSELVEADSRSGRYVQIVLISAALAIVGWYAFFCGCHGGTPVNVFA